ncbi:MAG: DNA primase [Bdellovibrionota bacterium]
MGARVPQNVIDEILLRTSIVQFLSERMQLKKAGKEYKGLCPFHQEKTPSFTVSEEKNFYHCFGCGAHGTALTFLLEQEKMTFPEAIRYLAERAGIVLEWKGSQEDAPRQDDPLYSLLERACEFFSRLLADDPAAEGAREYATRRGLSGEVEKEFGIGWAPSGWQRLAAKLRSAGINPREAMDAGLLVKREESGSFEWENLRDKFVDRLMFPIHDARGRVVGFGGRALREDQQPKYLNSPTTALFHKGKLLYNLHRARRAIQDEGAAIVVEGYMDLIALWRAGIRNTVATLGTALTSDHVRLLRRYVGEGGKLLLLFDSDAAGRAAAFKSLEVVLPEGLHPFGVTLSGGKDPDEVLAREGAEALQRQIGTPVSLLDTFLDEVVEETRGQDPSVKRQAIARVAPVLLRIRNAADQDRAIRRLYPGLNFSEETFRAELARHGRPRREERGGGPAVSAAPKVITLPPAERAVVALFLQLPEARRLLPGDVAALFTNAALRKIHETAGALFTETAGTFSPAVLLARLSEQQEEGLTALAAELLEDPFGRPEEEDIAKAVGDALSELKRRDLRRRREDLQARLSSAQSQGGDSVSGEILRELLDLERQLRQ